MRKQINGVLALSFGVIGGLSLSLSVAIASDLDDLNVPVFEDRAGFALAVTQYSLETDAELLEGEPPEHSVELSGLIQPPKREDVLCFGTTMKVTSAEDSRGRNLLIPERRRGKAQQFKALLPSADYRDRKGEPLMLCPIELDSVSLDRSGYEVEELVVVATAVVVDRRESEEVDAEVTGRFIDIGHGTEVQVSSKEIDNKDNMTVQLKIKRSGDQRSPVIDSVYALNKRGKRIGGGRWVNELDLFAKRYEVELTFPLTDDEDAMGQLEIVLATKYEVQEVELTIEDLFQR